MATIDIERKAPLAPGEPAPDFQLPAAQGGELSLSAYRGSQSVLLIFLKGMT